MKLYIYKLSNQELAQVVEAEQRELDRYASTHRRANATVLEKENFEVDG